MRIVEPQHDSTAAPSSHWKGPFVVSELPIVSIVTFLPLVGVALLLCVDRQREAAIKHLAFAVSLATFCVSLALYSGFRLDVPGMQFTERTPWIGWLGAEYHVGVDGISLLLVLLTTFLTAVAILSSYSAVTTSVKEYMICMLLLETGMLGAFVSLDIFPHVLARPVLEELDGIALLSFTTTPANPIQLVAKRGIDFALSLACVLVTLPIQALAALLIRITSHGPVFFRQVAFLF